MSGQQIWGQIRRAGRLLLDLLLPPRCLSCGVIVSDPGTLCPDCWGRIRFLTPPCCACCGLPFSLDLGPDMLCGACLAEPPAYSRARAAIGYDEASKPLILRFKHADRLAGTATFARWMARAGADVLPGAEVIVPVPLHPIRLVQRRYNQAALLGNALARQTGISSVPDALRRVKPTPSQGHLSRLGRARNVASAFAIARPDAIADKVVVLVDDVMTTGATVSSCARVLLRAGASEVRVLTLSRVVPD